VAGLPFGPMAPSDHKDYSATPLWKKLGIREGARVFLSNAPMGFRDALSPMPGGAAILSRVGRDLDVIVAFDTRLVDLARRFVDLKPSLASDGRLWVAWPKRASKVPTDIGFAQAQGLGLEAGLVDNKSASIDDVFQGLQFVYRKADRASR
jgi:hypothetical protein